MGAGVPRSTFSPAVALVVLSLAQACEGGRAEEPRGHRRARGAAEASAPARPPAGVPRFACEGARCEQPHPAMPDSRDWTCAGWAGAALCVGGIAAAGIPAPRTAPGWRCGPRRGSSEESVCLHARPDFPDGQAIGWRCHYESEAGVKRVCQRDRSIATLGAACEREQPCVDGALCAEGVCEAPPGAPSCWLDADCEGGVCRFGFCRR